MVYLLLFFLAKSAVDSGKLDVAEKELKWSMEHEKDPALVPMIKTRLARVMAAQGQVDDAIALMDKSLNDKKSNSFENIYLAAKGDFLLLKNNKKEAIAAYQKAYDIMQSRKQQAPILKMKLENLGVLAGDV
jgi:predicted negative regulator of RcsB-dependent stress response